MATPVTNNLSSIESLLQSTLNLSNLPQEASENLKQLETLLFKEKQRNSNGVLSKFRLDNQVALVTGGSRGIGFGLAQALGEAGCKVAIASINFENTLKAAELLKQKGIETLAIQVDVTNKESVQKMMKTILDTWGDLHIAVNNAGVCEHRDSLTLTEENWDFIMNTNLKGVFFCAQVEAEHMAQKGYGRIINMASMSGSIVNTPQSQVVYNSSKAGLIHLTKSLAAEWVDKGITVNSISPGYIRTEMTNHPHVPKWESMIPMKRFGEIDELAGVTLLLASSLSSYMTGSDVIVDGGYTLW